MKKQKPQSNINLETLAGGAFAEKLNEALMQVAENIQNPNTEATAKRGITVNIKFAPNKSRQMVSTSISVQTKLAATEAIETQIAMGVNMRTGQIELAEYDGKIPGQLSMFSMEQSEEPEPPMDDTETEPEQVPPTGKPLDLRSRGSRQNSEALASVAASGLIAGRDFDPDTGEIYEAAGQSADDQKTTAGRVVKFNSKTKQA